MYGLYAIWLSCSCHQSSQWATLVTCILFLMGTPYMQPHRCIHCMTHRWARTCVCVRMIRRSETQHNKDREREAFQIKACSRRGVMRSTILPLPPLRIASLSEVVSPWWAACTNNWSILLSLTSNTLPMVGPVPKLRRVQSWCWWRSCGPDTWKSNW